MALQKKVNKLQVEHVSEEEVRPTHEPFLAIRRGRWTSARWLGEVDVGGRGCTDGGVRSSQVDQLFYSLEVKEAQLEQAQKDAVRAESLARASRFEIRGVRDLRVHAAQAACAQEHTGWQLLRSLARSPLSRTSSARQVKLGKEKSDLEEEVMTARQLTARGGNLVNQEAKFVEIHHHNDMSDDDSDSDSDAKPASAPAVAVS